MIKVLTFDLDDTLWAVEPVIQRANSALYQWLQQYAPRFTDYFPIDAFATLRAEVVQAYPEREHSVTAVRLAVLRRGLSQCGYGPAETERLTQRAFTHFLQARNQVQLFPHARAMLEQLHQHYRLGALSNGNADVNRVGLGDLFHFSLNADQVGAAKPDPLMFQKMLDLTGAAPDQVVHIGDSIEHDVLGAQRAGIHALWVNLNQQPWPGGVAPAIEVSCLSEIPERLQHFSSEP